MMLLQCALDELCEKLGADPLEFRLRNALRTGENSFLGYPIGETVGFRQVLEAMMDPEMRRQYNRLREGG